MTALVPAVAPGGVSGQVAALLAAIAHVETVGEADELRRRVRAVRAVAREYGQIRDLRQHLLLVEVALLVRVVELGGEDSLPASEREAGRAFAAMSPSEREALVRECRSRATAVGLWRSVMAERTDAAEVRARRCAGVEFASAPPPPTPGLARAEAGRMAEALAAVVEEFARFGEFSVEQMASEVIEAAMDAPEVADDPGFTEGVREVCRRVLRQARIEEFDGLPVPRFITCRGPGGEWLRIPTPSATVAHLDEMVEDRAAQAEQAVAAATRLREFRDRVRAVGGVESDTRLGDILRAGIAKAVAA